MQGVPTLWGNFEIKNVRLVKKMLNQFAQRRLENHLDQFEHQADRFEKLPLYFLTFHGEQSFDVVLDSMRLAIERHNVRHVIIDNLQFMIGSQCERRQEPNRYLDGSRRLDRFSFQDVVIGACRQFATDHDCHVTLVVHPRKEAPNEPLTNNSIFGGGKASQEADNVIILQMKWTDQFKFQKYVQVTKNRYDGDLGLVPISFSKEVEGFGVRSDKSEIKNIYKS
jgi:twinkle protein